MAALLCQRKKNTPAKLNLVAVHMSVPDTDKARWLHNLGPLIPTIRRVSGEPDVIS